MRSCVGVLFQRASLGSRLAFTGALCFAFCFALGRWLTLRFAFGFASGFALGGRIGGGRFVGFAGRIIAAYRRTVGFTTVGDIPARAFEDNAHWLKNASHCASARMAGSQRFIFKRLELLELSSAAVARIDIGWHSSTHPPDE